MNYVKVNISDQTIHKTELLIKYLNSIIQKGTNSYIKKEVVKGWMWDKTVYTIDYENLYKEDPLGLFYVLGSLEMISKISCHKLLGILDLAKINPSCVYLDDTYAVVYNKAIEIFKSPEWKEIEVKHDVYWNRGYINDESNGVEQ